MNAKLRLGTCVFLVACASASAGDWPHWRGPEQNGICRERGLIDSWAYGGKGNVNVLWESPIGGRATPIILNGRLFINCRTDHDVNDPKEKIHAGQQVICLNAETGAEVWKHVFNVAQTDIPAPRVGWAAMVGDPETGYVYVHTVDGIFRCYDGVGTVVWEHSLIEEYGEFTGYGGRVQTPIIDEDRVIVSFLAVNWGELKAPPLKHLYYAFDKRTSTLLWVSNPGGRANDTTYSCPVVAVINGVRMLIGGNADGGIYAMKARTGERIWGFRMSRRALNASVVVEGNYVYASHGEDNTDSLEFGRVQCIDATGTGDVTKTHSVWRVDGIKADYPSLLVKDGVLYVVADNAKLHAFDSKTGKRLWEHDLGTVGKGSPVWADGKLYTTEVNGRIHILRPSREQCQTLCTVHLKARDDKGDDEIHASPAIADGRIYFVTRDRILCVGKKDHEVALDRVPPLPAERPPESRIARLQLVPWEASLRAGDSVEYALRAFDPSGRVVNAPSARLQTHDLPDARVEGMKLFIAPEARESGGTVTATAGGLKAAARLRVYPRLPWKWTFDGFKDKQVPATWTGAFGKLTPAAIDGQTALVNRPGPGKPSGVVWIGPPTMKGYTIQADVLLKEQKRRLSSVGLTACRYNFILVGNAQRLNIQDWAPHLRLFKEIPFRSGPDTWYTLKMRVKVADGIGHVRGKAWKRGEPEPKDWTLAVEDPHPIEHGSPGLYYYALADSYFDNVIVAESE